MAIKKGLGNIGLYNNINVSVFTDYNMDIFMSPSFSAFYNRGEFIEIPNHFYFRLDFSNIPNRLERLSTSTIFGLLYNNTNNGVDITDIDFKMTGETGLSYNITLNDYEVIIPDKKNIYYLTDKNYTSYTSRSEENYFGNMPVNMTESNTYTFRTDIDIFEYPFFDVYQGKKILDYSCGINSIYDVKSNYNWFFSDNKGLDFNPIVSGGTPISITGMVNTTEGLSVISDVDGVLKIYSDGLTVYNGNHQIMGNGSGLNGYSSATQSVVIVPQPNTNNYYIFNSSVSGVSQGLNYSIADISVNNGEGFLTTKNSILLTSPITEKLTSCSSYNNVDYWVITHTSGDSKFYSYLLSNSGLTGPVISNVGSIHNDMMGYLKISNDGSRLACALYNQDIVELFDFDITGGTISNPITLSGITYNKGPYGLEFSNDSTKLYITDGADTNIYQLDITYTSSTEIEDSIITITDQAISLGALQMAPDGRIYVIDRGLGALHRINETNRKGFYCNYEHIYLSGLSSTQLGLPNAIAGEYNNCSRSVFINKLDREKYTFNVHFNDDNNVIDNKKLDFRSEIYKYDKSLGLFNDVAVFSSDTFVYSAITSGNSKTISFDTNLSVLGEGEFLIKGYYEYPITTFTMGSLNRRYSNYPQAKKYNYNGNTDWYFINLYESEKPIFNNAAGSISDIPQNGFIVRSEYITYSGQTTFNVNGTPSNNVVVAYNGSVLSTSEYTYSNSLITILSGITTPILGDIITYFYLPVNSDGTYNPNYKYEGYTVNTITSGVTDNQSITTKIYYNTDKNKFEYYLDSSIGGGDIVFIVNGSTLLNNVEYYQSTSNDKRVILEIDIYNGDIIEVFYYSRTTFIGSINTTNVNIGWAITNPPISGITGEFVLEMSPSGDYDFNTIVYSATTDYVINQVTYSSNINITGGTIGDSYLYRVKNVKKYQPIIGIEIESIKYSDIIPITITSNAINSY
jgi:hypothetical protein